MGAKFIDVLLMLDLARESVRGTDDYHLYNDAIRVWNDTPRDERDRRRDTIADILAGKVPSVPWGDIAERVARHAWEVWHIGYGDEARDACTEEDVGRWAALAWRWCNGRPVDRDDGPAMRAARHAARALAEALGYRLDGAPAEVPPTNAWGEHATYERHDRSARATATRALASLLTFSDREGYTLNIDGSRCNPEQDAESRGHNRHRFEALMRALLAFKGAP